MDLNGAALTRMGSLGAVKIAIVDAFIALLVAGIIVYSRSQRAPAATTQQVQAVPVIAVKVRQHDVPIMLTGLGTVMALNSATIHSQITGLLVSVNFNEGQSVKKGELLGQIDPRTFQAQLDQAEAALERDQTHLKNAQLNLQRYTDLAKTDSIARQQLDNQQAAVDELNAQIKSDQAAVENATTRSTTTQPIGADGNALVVVAQVQPISVIFTLATTNIAEIQAAMASDTLQAIALSQDDKTQLDVGQLVALNNQADPGSGTVQLKAVFPNQQRKLWPGTSIY